MQIILLKDVEKIGRKGEVVRVRDGFARNFLFPKNFAMASTRANQKFVEEQKKRAAIRREKEKVEAEKVAQKISKVKLVLEVRAGEKDKLFGSVTPEDISKALTGKGYQFNKKQIHLEEAIRSLGKHTVTVDVFPEVKAKIEVEVVRQS